MELQGMSFDVSPRKIPLHGSCVQKKVLDEGLLERV